MNAPEEGRRFKRRTLEPFSLYAYKSIPHRLRPVKTTFEVSRRALSTVSYFSRVSGKCVNGLIQAVCPLRHHPLDERSEEEPQSGGERDSWILQASQKRVRAQTDCSIHQAGTILCGAVRGCQRGCERCCAVRVSHSVDRAHSGGENYGG